MREKIAPVIYFISKNKIEVENSSAFYKFLEKMTRRNISLLLKVMESLTIRDLQFSIKVSENDIDKGNITFSVNFPINTKDVEEKIELIKNFIQENNIEVDNEKLFDSYLVNIGEKVSSFYEVLEYLHEKVSDKTLQRFSIELFDTYECNEIEELYFLLYFPDDVSEEQTEQVLFELSDFIYEKYISLRYLVHFARR